MTRSESGPKVVMPERFVIDSDRITGAPGGELAGCNVLMLHGFGGDKTQLQPVAERLAGRGATVLLPTLRGQGSSCEPDIPLSCLDLAADIHRLLASASGRWHVVGYSHGGLVGVVAARCLPSSSVASVVSIDESFAPHPDRMIDDAQEGTRFLRWHFDFGHLLDRVPVPALLLVAAQSHMVEAEERKRLGLLAAPSFRVEEIPGDHRTCIEHPEELTTRIARFLLDVEIDESRSVEPAILLRPIGYVRSPRKEPDDDGWGPVEGSIHLDPRLLHPEAVSGLQEFSHIEVLFSFHLCDPAEVNNARRHPRGRRDLPSVGVLAQRVKDRPNHLGVSRCELITVEGLVLHVRGLDAVDGTPVVDVKPYLSSLVPPASAVREPSWVQTVMAKYF